MAYLPYDVIKTIIDYADIDQLSNLFMLNKLIYTYCSNHYIKFKMNNIDFKYSPMPATLSDFISEYHCITTAIHKTNHFFQHIDQLTIRRMTKEQVCQVFGELDARWYHVTFYKKTCSIDTVEYTYEDFYQVVLRLYYFYV